MICPGFGFFFGGGEGEGGGLKTDGDFYKRLRKGYCCRYTCSTVSERRLFFSSEAHLN